jgi:beta-lactamase class A
MLVVLIVIAGVAAIKFHHHSSPAVASQTPKTSSTPAKANTADTAPAVSPHNAHGLQTIIDNWAAQHSFDATVVIQELNGQERGATQSADEPMTTASTYKIFVAYAILHQVEQGKYTMSTTTRTGQTVQNALQQMILNSDNTSAEALGFLVGWSTVNQLAAGVGAIHTDINNYNAAGQPLNGDKQSTATDLTLMITKLQNGKLLNTSNTQLLLGLMKTQHYRERVPAGVPSGIAVADKPGWLNDVENDAAIVYGPKSTYTIVVMTNGSTTQPLADLSKLVYDYLQA